MKHFYKVSGNNLDSEGEYTNIREFAKDIAERQVRGNVFSILNF